MKKCNLTIILTLIFCLGHSQNKFHYGVGVGSNLSTFGITPSETNNYKIKPGHQLNLVFDYDINKFLGLRIEPGYANRGAASDRRYTVVSWTNINYFTTSFLVKYAPANKFSVLLGTELAYRLSAYSRFGALNFNQRSAFNSTYDISIIAGVEYNLFDQFYLGLLCNRGTISTIKNFRITDESGNDLGRAKLYNKGVAFIFSYRFENSKK